MNFAINFVRNLYKRFPGFRRIFWRLWYQYFSGKYQEDDLVFMNYGYSPTTAETPVLALEAEDERERLPLQLYDHVVRLAKTRLAPLGEKQILEVGSGRGGGASYVARYMKPGSMTGIDISRNNVAFCQKRHRVPNLTFKTGDAEDLPMQDSSMDGVVNVESSHCYESIPRFFSEVFRVLRPGGYFFYADVRDRSELPELKQTVDSMPFEVIKEEFITANVLLALKLDHDRRVRMIGKAAPAMFHKPMQEFSGLEGSRIYNAMDSRETEYVHYVLGKPG